MRGHVTTFLSLSLLGLVVGCTTPSPPRHESQAVPGVDLASYGTFSLTNPAGASEADPPMRMLDVNIRSALKAEMTKRGFREVEANPDLRIDYETTAQDKIKSSPVRIGIGMGSWGGNVGGSVGVSSSSVQSYQEGRLIIHVADTAKNQEVWNGTVSGKVDRSSLDADAVARVVALAMESFPVRDATPIPDAKNPAL